MKAEGARHSTRSVAIAAAAPPLTAVGFILLGYVANDVPIDLLWRPLFISLAIAAIIEVVAWATLGPVRGSVWAFVAVAAVLGMFVLSGATLLALTVFSLVRSAPGREYALVGLLATAFAVTFVGFLVATGIAGGAFEWTPIGGEPIEIGEVDQAPNIHLLMLDGYPRADVLAAAGYDNGPFLTALEERGFDVYDDSRSNYDLTPFSLVSILSGAHVESIRAIADTQPRETVVQQTRIVSRALLDPPMIEALERAGFHTRLMTGDVVGVTLGGADEVLSAGTANNFELDALQRTPWAGVLEWFGWAAGQHRSHIEDTLNAFSRAPQQPTFTFAHVIAPHPPLVYRADGSPGDSAECYPETCPLFHPADQSEGVPMTVFWSRLEGHVAHLNRLVLVALDELVERDPESVIVVFSDHGMVFNAPEDRYRNLIVARTPRHRDLLGSKPTPINILPRVLDAYVGAHMPLLADDLFRRGPGEGWVSTSRMPPDYADLLTGP